MVFAHLSGAVSDHLEIHVIINDNVLQRHHKQNSGAKRHLDTLSHRQWIRARLGRGSVWRSGSVLPSLCERMSTFKYHLVHIASSRGICWNSREVCQKTSRIHPNVSHRVWGQRWRHHVAGDMRKWKTQVNTCLDHKVHDQLRQATKGNSVEAQWPATSVSVRMQRPQKQAFTLATHKTFALMSFKKQAKAVATGSSCKRAQVSRCKSGTQKSGAGNCTARSMLI